MKRLAIGTGALVVVAACAARSPSAVAPPVGRALTPAPAVAASVVKRVTPDAPFRALPPPPASAAPFVAPEPRTVRLRNGIPLTLVSQASNVVAITVVASGGVVEVGADKAETIHVLMKTMLDGSKTRNADALDNALAAAAMPRFEWDFHADGVVVSAMMTSGAVHQGVTLLADVLLHPAFEEVTFAWYQGELARGREAAATEVELIGENTLRKALFGRHPYSAVRGSSADIRAAKRADVTALHARLFDGSRLAIVAAGGVNDGVVFAAVDAAFGGIARRERAPAAPATPTLAAGPTIVVVDRPGASVTRIDAGFIGPAANAADVDAAEMALQLLVGFPFGRLALKLREDLHAAWVRPDWYRLRSAELLAWQSMLPTVHVSQALAEMRRQLESLAGAGPTDEEASMLRDFSASKLGALIGTPGNMARTYGEALITGLPPEAIKQSVARRATLDAATIRSAAARWLDPTRMRIVLVGDWATMRESVTALGWGVTLVPAK